ncbi:MAG: STT3 domain-containing protein [Candidatus Hadarchaeota archaeon]
MNRRRWLIVGYLLFLMVFSFYILSIPGEKGQILTTEDSGWFYDIASVIDNTNALAENNPFSHPPSGFPVSPTGQGQPLMAVVIYRGLKTVIPSLTLIDVTKYLAPFVFALTLIPVFLTAREFKGDVAGCFAAFLLATMLSTIPYNKIGSFDREPVQLLFGAWTVFFVIKLLKADKRSIPIFAVLGGMTYGFFMLTWSGALYIAAIVVLCVLLMLLVKFVEGLFKLRNEFAAISSAIRTHGYTIAGLLFMLLVTTVILWTLGQSPTFWAAFFQTLLGYVGIQTGGAGEVTFSRYATEMEAPQSWSSILTDFYLDSFITIFVLIIATIAFILFVRKREPHHLFVFAWLAILAAMILPGRGQTRFVRLWWSFLPVVASVGAATLLFWLRDHAFTRRKRIGILKRFRTPLIIVLAIAAGTPFVANAYSYAKTTVPVIDVLRVGGLYADLMESFAWIKENTPQNSVFSVEWAIGHSLTGATGRASVVDGVETAGREGEWENNPFSILTFGAYTPGLARYEWGGSPSAIPKPPDYIYYTQNGRGYIYGLDLEAVPKSFNVNGRRTDVQRFPRVYENELRWYLRTYRENYNIKIDYVIFNYHEFCSAWYGEVQKNATSAVQITENYVKFGFDGGRDNIMLDLVTREVYRKLGENKENLLGWNATIADKRGNILFVDNNLDTMFWSTPAGVGSIVKVKDIVGAEKRLSDRLIKRNQYPNTGELLTIVFYSLSEYPDGEFYGSLALSPVGAGLTNLQDLQIGIRAFENRLDNLDYLKLAFTSSNNLVRVLKVIHENIP